MRLKLLLSTFGLFVTIAAQVWRVEYHAAYNGLVRPDNRLPTLTWAENVREPVARAAADNMMLWSHNKYYSQPYYHRRVLVVQNIHPCDNAVEARTALIEMRTIVHSPPHQLAKRQTHEDLTKNHRQDGLVEGQTSAQDPWQVYMYAMYMAPAGSADHVPYMFMRGSLPEERVSLVASQIIPWSAGRYYGHKFTNQKVLVIRNTWPFVNQGAAQTGLLEMSTMVLGRQHRPEKRQTQVQMQYHVEFYASYMGPLDAAGHVPYVHSRYSFPEDRVQLVVGHMNAWSGGRFYADRYTSLGVLVIRNTWPYANEVEARAALREMAGLAFHRNRNRNRGLRKRQMQVQTVWRVELYSTYRGVHWTRGQSPYIFGGFQISGDRVLPILRNMQTWSAGRYRADADNERHVLVVTNVSPAANRDEAWERMNEMSALIFPPQARLLKREGKVWFAELTAIYRGPLHSDGLLPYISTTMPINSVRIPGIVEHTRMWSKGQYSVKSIPSRYTLMIQNNQPAKNIAEARAILYHMAKIVVERRGNLVKRKIEASTLVQGQQPTLAKRQGALENRDNPSNLLERRQTTEADWRVVFVVYYMGPVQADGRLPFRQSWISVPAENVNPILDNLNGWSDGQFWARSYKSTKTLYVINKWPVPNAAAAQAALDWISTRVIAESRPPREAATSLHRRSPMDVRPDRFLWNVDYIARYEGGDGYLRYIQSYSRIDQVQAYFVSKRLGGWTQRRYWAELYSDRHTLAVSNVQPAANYNDALQQLDDMARIVYERTHPTPPPAGSPSLSSQLKETPVLAKRVEEPRPPQWLIEYCASYWGSPLPDGRLPYVQSWSRCDIEKAFLISQKLRGWSRGQYSAALDPTSSRVIIKNTVLATDRADAEQRLEEVAQIVDANISNRPRRGRGRARLSRREDTARKVTSRAKNVSGLAKRMENPAPRGWHAEYYSYYRGPILPDGRYPYVRFLAPTNNRDAHTVSGGLPGWTSQRWSAQLHATSHKLTLRNVIPAENKADAQRELDEVIRIVYEHTASRVKRDQELKTLPTQRKRKRGTSEKTEERRGLANRAEEAMPVQWYVQYYAYYSGRTRSGQLPFLQFREPIDITHVPVIERGMLTWSNQRFTADALNPTHVLRVRSIWPEPNMEAAQRALDFMKRIVSQRSRSIMKRADVSMVPQGWHIEYYSYYRGPTTRGILPYVSTWAQVDENDVGRLARGMITWSNRKYAGELFLTSQTLVIRSVWPADDLRQAHQALADMANIVWRKTHPPTKRAEVSMTPTAWHIKYMSYYRGPPIHGVLPYVSARTGVAANQVSRIARRIPFWSDGKYSAEALHSSRILVIRTVQPGANVNEAQRALADMVRIVCKETRPPTAPDLVKRASLEAPDSEDRVAVEARSPGESQWRVTYHVDWRGRTESGALPYLEDSSRIQQRYVSSIADHMPFWSQRRYRAQKNENARTLELSTVWPKLNQNEARQALDEMKSIVAAHSSPPPAKRAVDIEAPPRPPWTHYLVKYIVRWRGPPVNGKLPHMHAIERIARRFVPIIADRMLSWSDRRYRAQVSENTRTIRINPISPVADEDAARQALNEMASIVSSHVRAPQAKRAVVEAGSSRTPPQWQVEYYAYYRGGPVHGGGLPYLSSYTRLGKKHIYNVADNISTWSSGRYRGRVIESSRTLQVSTSYPVADEANANEALDDMARMVHDRMRPPWDH